MEEVKYLAEFPMQWGDMARRVYKSKAVAIREARKHLNACEDCNEQHYAEVWEYKGHKKTLVFEEYN